MPSNNEKLYFYAIRCHCFGVLKKPHGKANYSRNAWRRMRDWPKANSNFACQRIIHFRFIHENKRD